MDRETKELAIGSHKVVVKTYITGGEMREIEGVFTEGLQVSVGEDGKPVMPSLSADMGNKAQDKTIEMLVVNIDGKTENILEKILNFPKPEFDEVIAELNSMTEGLGKKKGKK